MHVRRATVVLALLAAAGCRGRDESSAAPEVTLRADRSVVLSDASAAYVRVQAARAPSAHVRSFAGRVTFDPRRVAELGPAVAGRVTSVRVVPGDMVKRNDPLLTIHAPDVATAQAQVAHARAARRLAEHAVARAQVLQRDGAGTEAELQQAEAALAQATSEEARATAALRALGSPGGVADYVLRSPIDGEVIERNVAVGAQVSPGTDKPLLTVGDLSTVWVIADVFEQDLGAVTVGADATVELFALKGRTFSGKVTHLSSVIDPVTRAAVARVELPNPDGALRPGMSARVFVRGGASQGAEIPTSALLARRDRFFVFVRQRDGSFAEREVQVGEQYGQHALVTSGLVPGEEVVTEGAILLDVEVNEALR